MDDHEDEGREPLSEVARRIEPALRLLIDLLRDGVATASAEDAARGYDSSDDKSFFNHAVRRYVREQVRPYFPNMKKSAPMSPIHLHLGPHQLKVLHAEDGGLPSPKTDARKAFYGRNDLGLFSLNVYAPDELYDADDEAQEVPEGSLVLIWDSEGTDLTQATLIRPWKTGNESEPLLTPVVQEDLDEIGRRRDAGSESGQRTGTGDDDRDPSDGMGDSGTQDDDEGEDQT
jgi:hypothetical protein